MSSVLTKFEKNLSAGNKIINKFDSNIRLSSRYVILLAQMQSGKTFVYSFVLCEMWRLKRVTHIVIFSGNAEVALREQTKMCLENEDFQECYKAHLLEELGTDEEDVQVKWNQIKEELNCENNFRVIWGTAMKKMMRPMENTLFIWDESHFAQTQGMCPDKFLEKMGILPNGDQTSLDERNNYMLSVSATPFSEASDSILLEQGKMMITFTPSNAYLGVAKMIEHDMIVGYENPVDCARELMMNSDERRGDKKFGIVRIGHDGVKKNVLASLKYEELAEELGWDVRLYYDTDDPRRIRTANEFNEDDEDEENEFIDLLNEEPERNTLILVKDHCRMGQQLPKQNISFVLETAIRSKTDVLLQGLLGRMCGYHNFTNIRIGLREKFTKGMRPGEMGELNRYLAFVSEVTRTGMPNVIPRKGKHIGIKGIQHKVPLIPVKINADMREGKHMKIEQLRQLKRIFRDGLIEDFNDEKDKERTKEIIEGLPEEYSIFKKHCAKRMIKDNSAATIWQAFNTQTASHLGTSCDIAIGIIGVYVAHRDFPGTGIVCGDVFIFRQKPNLEWNESWDMIPPTTKRELFCRVTETGQMIPSNGQCSEDLDPRTSVSVDLMKSAIMSRMERSFQEVEGLIISRSITSHRGDDSSWNGIYVTQEVFEALNPGGVIYEETKAIFRRQNVKIKLTKRVWEMKNGEMIVGNMCRIGKISW